MYKYIFMYNCILSINMFICIKAFLCINVPINSDVNKFGIFEHCG